VPTPYFLDSSAIVKCYLSEPGTAWMRSLFDSPDHELYIASIAGAEVIAAIARRVPAKSLPAAVARSVIAAFRADFANAYSVISISDAVIARAMHLAEQHHLRGYDAVQLAAALELHAIARSRAVNLMAVLVAADKELLAAAQSEGLRTVNPEDQPNEPF